MVNSPLIRTVVPIIFLIGAGFLSRKMKLLREGDERVLSAYVYYFALPSLFLINMAATDFTLEIFTLLLAGVIPNLLAMCVYKILQIFIGFSRNTLYLLILSTIFGSTAFFGIPFLTFAFPSMEQLVTLSAALISVASVPITLTLFELYGLQESTKAESIKHVAKRLVRNPLIISICIGVALSVLNIGIPDFVADSIRMLGETTSAVAIFMLGVFLYGRTYSGTGAALKLSLLRALLLPVLAIFSTRLLGVTGIEASVLILMNGMPIAISMIILSERYNFYKETMATLVLVSSLGATIYQNLWLWLLGYY